MIDFRLPLNFCACEFVAEAAAIAFREAAIDAVFNCFDRLDEWCSEVDDVKFLTNVDASSLDGVSPVWIEREQERHENKSHRLLRKGKNIKREK